LRKSACETGSCLRTAHPGTQRSFGGCLNRSKSLCRGTRATEDSEELPD
jgi:hypothetical protein